MAPKASAIQARTRTATFSAYGDEWEIEYRPFSQNTIREATQGDEDEQMAGLSNLLARVIVRWNLTDDDDRPLPFDISYLAGWGLDYVRALLEGLMEDMQGKKPTPISSSARSVQAATA